MDSRAGERNNHATNQPDNRLFRTLETHEYHEKKERTEVRGLESWWFHGPRSHIVVSDRVFRAGLMLKVRWKQRLERGEGFS